ncbi:MAG: 4-oxalomesaconate tautomerase [Alphaproteobacteria bacterium]|nr:MAG: 4-oxalomesaconate tautomerase [Alphaproteobacteria bacterium]
MDDLIRIPCVLMRGGTSKGPFFLDRDLPGDPDARDALLLEIMGSGHPLQIDGIGGGNPLTSKVAIVGPASRADADVDYLFAQVTVGDRSVDTSPNCGNMLAGVGPFAIEAGLVAATPGTTRVRIHNVNTRSVIEARIATPDARVTYRGDAAIDGVPGTSAPVLLAFGEAAGAKTGRLLPTGALIETIEGIDVTLIDAAMPMVLVRATDLGRTGYEPAEMLTADAELVETLSRFRREAARRMGILTNADLVIPKPVLLAPARAGGTLAARYLMHRSFHTALATTGGVGLAIAAATPGTLAAQLAGPVDLPQDVQIEHPSGRLHVRLETRPGGGVPVAYVVRTARRLFEGHVLVRAPDRTAA